MTVTGLDAAAIGAIAFEQGIPLNELSTQRASLEAAFMELTHDSVEFRADSSSARDRFEHLGRYTANSRVKGLDRMTATTATVSTGRVTSTTEPGFGATLQSEWTKLRSLRSTWIIVSLAIGLSIGFSALIALVSGLTHDSWNDTMSRRRSTRC